MDQAVFTKIKVNFLLVGHTHDHIDKMFSTFSRQLSRYNAFTLPQLVNILCEAYTPRPNVVHLTQIYDFKRYISHDPKSKEKVLAQLNNISFNHVFLLKKEGSNGLTLLYAKQYSSSPQWEPNEGCHFLLHVSRSTIYGAKQMPYESKKQLHSEIIEEQEMYWIQQLDEKKKHIDKAKKYAVDQDVSWWDTFFEDQRAIINNYIKGNWPLDIPFTWSIHVTNVFSIPHQTPQFERDTLVHPQQRDIYVGPRLTRGAESIWHGNLQDITVGMLIATPAEGNELGHPFWIGKVLEVIMHEDQNKIKSLKVHWYSTRCKNAFAGKYTMEMLEISRTSGKRKRQKNVRSTSLLNLDDVDILVYGFSLTKSGHLRKSTINIIKQKLPALQDDLNQRQTRSATCTLGNHHLLLDEDNALIATSEDEQEESQLYISYSSDST